MTRKMIRKNDQKVDQKKEWKERAEYELYLSITKSCRSESVAGKPRQMENAKYPQSDFADLRPSFISRPIAR